MNTLLLKKGTILFLLLSLVIISCEKEKVTLPDEGELNTDNEVIVELPENTGELGFIIDVQQIRKRGYQPKTVNINIDGELSGLSTQLTVDKDLHKAKFFRPKKNLSEAEIDALAKGIKVTFIVESANGTVLAEKSESNLIVDDAGKIISLETDLPALFPSVELRKGVDYFMTLSENRAFAFTLVTIPFSNDRFIGLIEFKSSREQRIQFIPSPNRTGIFKIKTTHPTENYLKETVVSNRKVVGFTVEENDASEFKIQWIADGKLTIASTENQALFLRHTAAFGNKISFTLEENPEPYNILAADLSYNFEDRGTNFLTPIFPASNTDFAFKQAIKNCGAATVELTVGVDESREVTTRMTQTQSLELFSSETSTEAHQVNVEVSGEFFGIGVSGGYTGTFTNQTSNSITNTSTSSSSIQLTETVQTSFKRKVTVEAKNSIVIYDAIQSYDDVKIPFVQQVKLTARYPNGDALTGKELQNQLIANQVTGIISEVGTDFVVVSLEGETLIGSFIQTQTETVDGEPCKN